MKSFLSNRETISGERVSGGSVRLSQEAKSGVIQLVSSEPNGPKIETIAEKGVVQKIIITCKCGEVIKLDCKY
jgi:hypothetical protein